MNRKRFIIEMGTGVDQHGQNMTEAATRAVKDAVARVCLVGLLELIEVDSMMVDVQVACPSPGEVNTNEVLRALPFGEKEIRVVQGGMLVKGHRAESLGDRSDEMVVANAAVTVYLDADKARLRS
jgi:uncharacterized protein (TIGR02058 family)